MGNLSIVLEGHVPPWLSGLLICNPCSDGVVRCGIDVVNVRDCDAVSVSVSVAGGVALMRPVVVDVVAASSLARREWSASGQMMVALTVSVPSVNLKSPIGWTCRAAEFGNL
eukprot:2053594-Pleurochrysis_carterae.AAC.1